MVGCGSTMSSANAALRNAMNAGAVSGIPVGVVAYTVVGAGTASVGGVVSATVTVNDAVEVCPCASLALQVTVVAPSGNTPPEAGAHVTGIGPSTASTAVGVV